MASRSRGKRSRANIDLQNLIRQKLDSSASFTIVRTWSSRPGDDRSQAIVVGAVLEQALERAIATHFVLNDNEIESLFIDQAEGNISNFAVKIKLAYALGVIETIVRKELTLIKNIRNVFAHTKADISFATPAIIKACAELTLSPDLLGSSHLDAKLRFAKSVEVIYLYFAHIDLPGFNPPLRCSTSEFYKSVFLHHDATARLVKTLKEASEPSQDR